MNRHSDEYDVILLGSGLGGLIAGTLLSKKNFNVLLLNENRYHSCFEKEGYRFVPFSNFSEKRLNVNFLKNISNVMSLSLPVHSGEGDRQREKWKEKVVFQVVLPEARIDLFCDRFMIKKEWRREFPTEVAQIENFFEDMDQLQRLLKDVKTKEGPETIFLFPPPSPKRRWFSFEPFPQKRLGDELSSFSKEFKEFIQLQLISWGNLYSNQFPISLASYLLLDSTMNEWVSNVDLERLKNHIFDKYLQSGGIVEGINEVEVVKMMWRKGFKLFLEEGRKTFQSKYLILNSPIRSHSNLFDRKRKVLSKWKERVRPQYALLPLFLGIKERVVPVGMRDLLVSILDLKKPYEGGNTLFIALSQKGDESEAPGGKRALTVESLIPLDKLDQTSLSEHRKGVMDHLHHLFPFLNKNIELMEWDWGHEQCLSWSYPHLFYELDPDFRWKEGVVPTRITKNLYFIGKENFPYLGLQGEVTSGLIVAQQILQRSS
jgi:phytoene dehydrogenase-like protein